MQRENMRYGQFLRARRVSDRRGMTLKDIAGELGVSVSFASDVEQGRRKLYDEEKTEKLMKLLAFTEQDAALMFDLAAKESFCIPRDLEDILMYSDAGEMARFALRMTKKGIISANDWRQFVLYINAKEAKQNA